MQGDCRAPKPVWRLIRQTNLRDNGDPIAARSNVNHLGLRDWLSVSFHGEVQSGFTSDLRRWGGRAWRGFRSRLRGLVGHILAFRRAYYYTINVKNECVDASKAAQDNDCN